MQTRTTSDASSLAHTYCIQPHGHRSSGRSSNTPCLGNSFPFRTRVRWFSRDFSLVPVQAPIWRRRRSAAHYGRLLLLYISQEPASNSFGELAFLPFHPVYPLLSENDHINRSSACQHLGTCTCYTGIHPVPRTQPKLR